jgi:hypothetical protein
MPRVDSLHLVVAADSHAVPLPFRSFAVRSDEPGHAYDARLPYGRVHLLRADWLDAVALADLAREGFSRARVDVFSDIEHAHTDWPELVSAAAGAAGLIDRLAVALQSTGVLGLHADAYRTSLAMRVDYLATLGAGFHNDVNRHGCRCLFWLLTLQAHDVEFVMPHAGVRMPLAPGDFILFDPVMAHGLCRPADNGQAVPASFEQGEHQQQMFLTGEFVLTDAQWAALDAPWLPVEVHAARAALDLMVAEFDDRTGAIKRLRTLRDGMSRSTCHVED